MKNEIGRKLTSLTLMTIMFAGGLTIAAPTMFPDTDAQASQKLFVSTTTLQGNAILEIMVSDSDKSDTSATQAGPLVSINGNQNPVMVQSTNGNWYAYVADLSNVVAAEAISAGWDYGDSSCSSGIGSGGSVTILGTKATTGITPYVEVHNWTTGNTGMVLIAVQCLDLNAYSSTGNNVKGSALDAGTSATTARDEINMLQGIPNVNTNTSLNANNKGNAGMEANATDSSVSGWPLIQAWEMDATSSVCYAGECIDVSLGSANSDTAISVNKTVVQDNDHVIVTITDPGLNLDPTFPDEWTFSVTETDGSETTTWRGNETDTYGGNTALTRANLLTTGFGDGGFLAVTDGGAALGNPVSAVVTVYETGANTGVFTTLMVNDTSDIVTTTRANASSDDVITINYAGNKVNLVVAYTDMSMTLDAGDEWAPGEAATLTIVDPDANKMSTSAETLDVNDEAQTIPTITLGSPYYCNNNGFVTVSDSAGNTATHVTAYSLTSTDDKRCKFTSSVTNAGTT